MVRQATGTAVSASISTPVGPVTLTLASTRQPGSLSSVVLSSVTLLSASGWHSGMRSEVRFAAMMPAIRAVPSTSPFLALPSTMSLSVSALITTKPSATATRSVASFADTSIICASPLASIWVREGLLIASWRLRKQGAGGGGDVGLPHQAFADEEGRDADFRQPRNVGGREDAALTDHDAVLRHRRRQCLAGRERGLEGAQIAVVDAEQRRAPPQGADKLFLIVNFEQHVHSEIERRVFDVARRCVIQRGHDDQDAIGAMRARFHHLIGVVHEILAQHRQ